MLHGTLEFFFFYFKVSSFLRVFYVCSYRLPYLTFFFLILSEDEDVIEIFIIRKARDGVTGNSSLILMDLQIQYINPTNASCVEMGDLYAER